MAKPADDITIADLQEALKNEAFGKPAIEQDELEPGASEISPEPEDSPSVETAESDEEVKEEETEAPKEPKEPTHRALTPEELDSMFVRGKVNGEEREYSLKELLAIRQTQDAAKHKLDEYKELLKTARESLKAETPKPEPKVEEEYLTDEEKRVRALEAELNEIRRHQQNFEETSLTEAEERHMRTVFERDGLSEEAAATRLKQIVDNYPDAAEFARDLFTSNPKNREDLNKRIKTFNTLWHLGKSIEMPQVVQKAVAEAEQKGKTQAKLDAKRQLTDTAAGQADMREPSRAERLKELSKAKNDDAYARFMLDNSVVVKSFE